ncbi:non-ribosomal peptide synthetase [Streptacidiphilus sp. 4-A2]|nr:non-ribosomal peptide synthetase [Streptacidiphilus sp. 4-A2]
MKSEPLPDSLVELFARTVDRHPGRPAVTDRSRTLSYRELDLASDELAARLQQIGVGAEERVGVHLARSAEVFVAILGILKSGAAYVAVDTRYPEARRDLMLTLSGAKVVVTEPDRAPEIAHLGIDTVTATARAAADPDRPLHREAPPADRAASVLFTSGSSGVPKAVVLEHGNIVSFACNPELPRLLPQDRTGQISSLSFDAFHFEMWTTFACGAEVVVLPAVPELLAAGFQQQLRERGITAMLVPTMVVNHVVREDPDAFSPLRIVQVGGDVILPSSCRKLLGGGFQGQLFNLYGPTEITTACTVHRVTAQDAERDTIPIGRPSAGVSLQVLDPELAAVEPGTGGELYVGGPGVARGYLDRPDLTRERFVELPLPEGPGRFYRTGDLVRQREDGALEFLGRADDQVKIRGYRVEPGEVERTLRAFPGVHDIVVLPHGDGAERQLVAFTVFETEPAGQLLRAFAEAQLPHFMVPSRFVVLPVLPTSDHGKRDLAALRALLDTEQPSVPKQQGTDTVRYLIELWKELLETDQVGVDDGFFELGGHSLLAFRMQRRISRELGVELEPRTIINIATLGDLADEIDAAVPAAAVPVADATGVVAEGAELR